MSVVAAMLLSSAALGASFISYELQLGGDPDVVGWEDSGFPPVNPQYSAGDPTDGQVFDLTVQDPVTVVTWDAVVSAGGSHENPTWDGGFLSDGISQINGVANLVFDLELREGTPGGPLVGVNPFFSVINDGDTGDPLELAAFTHIAFHGDANDFPGNTVSNGPPSGTGAGRIFDPVNQGGVNMDRVQYPSGVLGGSDHPGGRRTPGYIAGVAEAGFPLESLDGKLIGMGVGYSQFSAASNVAGVGIDINAATEPYPGQGYNDDGGTYRGLAPRPVVEGQIDLSLLDTGTYCLVLVVPSDKPEGQVLNNIFRGDVSVTSGTPGILPFGIPADDEIGDDICFDVTGISSVTHTLVSAESVKRHGDPVSGTDAAIALNLTNTGNQATREPRRFDAPGGKADLDWLVLTFDGDISGTHVPGQVQLTTSSPFATTLTIADEFVNPADNTQLILELTLTAAVKEEAICTRFDITNSIANLAGASDVDVEMRVQYGNANGSEPGDLNTNLIDFGEYKLRNGALPGVEGYKWDWNLDGNINLIDAGEVKLRNGIGLDCSGL
jgi:hypothetical protein